LARLDDLHHRLLELLQVLRREGLLDVEVEVETVRDVGTDAELRVGTHGLHRLGHDVSGRVAQHLEPLRLVDGDRHDDVALGHLGAQVLEDVVDPGDHDRRIVGEQVRGSGARGHLLGLAVDGDLQVFGRVLGHGHSLLESLGARRYLGRAMRGCSSPVGRNVVILPRSDDAARSTRAPAGVVVPQAAGMNRLPIRL
jgi:hypothetical protein